MKTIVKTFLPVALLALSASAAHSRIWNDVTGEYRFEAEFIGVTDGLDAVTLIGMNGKEYNLPIDALSKKDRVYIAKTLKSTPSSKKMGIDDIPVEVMYKLQQAARRLWPEDEDAQADDVATKAKEYLSTVDNNSGPAASTTVQTGVPPAVVQQVRRRAEFRWPDDRKSQDAYIKTQLGCYRVLNKYKNPKLPQLAIVQLKQNARDLAADDYQAQLRYVHSQVQQGIAYLDAKREAAELEAAKKDQVAAKADTTTKPIALASVLAEPPASLVSHDTFVVAAPAAPLSQISSPPQEYARTTAWARTPQAECCQSSQPTATRSTKPSWKWFGRMQRN